MWQNNVVYNDFQFQSFYFIYFKILFNYCFYFYCIIVAIIRQWYGTLLVISIL